ncbi:MAG: argininosuccinate synthase [Deltaproteobacteria bacterium]|nr:argininosuccinate synthase [Deltaproteobacteria bacterium]
MKRQVVLAYSGGLDTSVILKWLVEERGFDVIAFIADVGQGEDLEAARLKAERTGATKTIVRDLTAEFVADYIFPMIRANTVYEGSYLLGTSIARPIIAAHQVDVARAEGAQAVSHGSTGKGNDQVRFELTYAALAPDLEVVAPWREWSFGSRSDLIAYADKHGIPTGVTKEKPYSMDRNILHLSFEGGILEDPWAEPPRSTYVLAVPPEEAPNEPEEVLVGFEDGNAVSVNGERLAPAPLLTKLNDIGGRHGVGRVDLVENRYVGIRSRGVYETPGGSILLTAHRAVESMTLDREVLRDRDALMPRYAQLVYNGFWFAPERRALQALVDEGQKGVTGEARLKLLKGSIRVTGRRSPVSLYDAALATFEADSVYKQADATGFIRLNALRLAQRARRDARLEAAKKK